MPIDGPPLPSTLAQDKVADAIKRRARKEYGDYSELLALDITLNGTSRMVDLKAQGEEGDQAYDALEPTGLVVTLNGVNLVPDIDYKLDARNGVLVLTTMPPANADLALTGTNYQFYNDEELDDFLYSAALKHTHQRVVTGRSVDSTGFIAYSHMHQTLATLPKIEHQPLSLLTAVEALWTLSADAVYDMNVSTADGTDLPRMQRYQAIMNQIESVTERYKDLCWQIGGVGFWRIHDGGRLRRVSLSTGRLIPLRAPREVDDASYPARILSALDVPEGTLANDNVIPCQQYNPEAEGGNPWSSNITVANAHLTQPGWLAVASITAGQRDSALVPITVVVVDDTHVTLSLTGAVTAKLPPYAPWRLTVTSPAGGTLPVVAGTFLTDYMP